MLAALAVLLVGLWPSLGRAETAAEAEIPPAPTQYVTDNAGMLSPQVTASLNARLAEYEQQTGHQVIVWIGQSLGGVPIEDFAVRAFEKWKIGRKDVDDGLAMFIFAEDRKIRIEVGYGLEGKIPDVIADQVIRNVMAPKLKKGQAEVAVVEGVKALVGTIEKGQAGLPDQGAQPIGAHKKKRRKLTLGEMIVGGILLVGFLILLITNPHMALFLLYAMMAGGRRGGFGGGGLGGGGFGGGGGMSGGGGASGGW